MTEEPQGFLGRWARRKNEVLRGETPADPVISEPPPASAAIPLSPAVSVSASPDVDEANAGPQEQKKELSLEDVSVLTKDSDFKPFMAQGVDASVRNAAVKKLFADPHFNVMDGLDIYIDDYSKSDPIPEAMLRQMTSVKFLGLFADNVEEAGKEALMMPREDANSPAPETIVQSRENADSDLNPVAPDQQTPIQTVPLPAAMDAVAIQEANANTDLRLQPDHATSAPGSGSGTR